MKQQRKGKQRRILAASERALTQIKKLPKGECSYYNASFCKPCAIELLKRCFYFENYVLPLEGELIEGYKRIYGG